MPAVPKPVTHSHLDPDQPRWDRVRVALEGHEGRRPDGVVLLDGGRVAGGREGPEPLELGEVAHGRTLASTCSEERDGGLFADQLLELGDGAVAAGRRCARRTGRAGAGRRRWSSPSWCARSAGWRSGWTSPPIPCGCPAGADRPRRSRRSAWPRGRSSAGRTPVFGIDDGRHAVEAPAPGVATEAAQHLVHGLDQMSLVFGLGEATSELSRTRQRADQQVGVAAPGGFWQLVPVPLDLFARRVLDLDGGPALDAVTGLAVRAQLASAQTSGEALVAEREPERRHLVIEGGGPDMGVLSEALAQIEDERLEWVGFSPPTLAGDTCPVEVGPDGLAITTDVTGDGRDRPTLLA